MARILPLAVLSSLLAQAIKVELQGDINVIKKTNDCQDMAGQAGLGEQAQDRLFETGAHMRAISAMKDHPDDADLQAACGGALSALVQWKKDLAQKVGAAGGEVGPIELMTLAMKNHPDNAKTRFLMSNLGSFCDFVDENRQRVNKAGAIEVAHQLIHDHYDAQTETAYQCFASTQCPNPTENAQKFKRLGYIEHSVKAMEDFPDVGSRGEAIFVLNMCWSDEDSLRRMVNASMIPGIISAIHDAPHKNIDVLSTPTRVFKSGMELMSKFSKLGPDTRQKLVNAGAIEAIDFALTTQGSAATHMAFGGDWSIVGAACEALASLAPVGDPQEKTVLNKEEPTINKVKSLMKEKFVSEDQMRCQPFLFRNLIESALG